jgi:membrane protease YdiL (CAAX protease family)
VAYDLTPFVIARALLLNGIFGLVAGWLYWRKSLEAAMAAHMLGHVVFTVATLALTRFAQ